MWYRNKHLLKILIFRTVLLLMSVFICSAFVSHIASGNIKYQLGAVKPGPGNTGPDKPELLKDIESLTIVEDGTVLKNVNVYGYINIKANNVTIKNFKVKASPDTIYPVRIFEGYMGTILENGEIDGSGCAHANVLGYNFTARRLNIHSSGADGLKLIQSSIVEGCWIHDLGLMKGAHADGIQISNGSKLRILGNNFDMPVKVKGTLSNAAVFIKADFADISDVLVEKNWMNGGSYTVYSINMSDTKNSKYYTKNVRIINNRFGRDYMYGIKCINKYTVWKNNAWEDNGKIAK